MNLENKYAYITTEEFFISCLEDDHFGILFVYKKNWPCGQFFLLLPDIIV